MYTLTGLKIIYIYIFGCFVTLKKLKVFSSSTVEIFVQLAVDFFFLLPVTYVHILIVQYLKWERHGLFLDLKAVCLHMYTESESQPVSNCAKQQGPIKHLRNPYDKL